MYIVLFFTLKKSSEQSPCHLLNELVQVLLLVVECNSSVVMTNASMACTFPISLSSTSLLAFIFSSTASFLLCNCLENNDNHNLNNIPSG